MKKFICHIYQYLTIIILIACCTAFARADSSNCTFQSSQTYYIWAKNGVNLREESTDKSAVIDKLPYGTSVQILSAHQTNPNYRLQYINNNYSENPQKIILDGCWIKIQAGQKEGYVFSRFVLSIRPMKTNESLIPYLTRVFHLKLQKKTSSRKKVQQYTQITQNEILVSKNKLTKLLLIETNSDPEGQEWPGFGGKLNTSEIGFEDGIIFVNAILPPHEETSFIYTKNKTYEYSMDGPGNSATLTKAGTGINFEWFDGGD